MNYDEITPEEKDIWDTGYAAGHDAGYEDGWNEYAESNSDDDWDEAHAIGYREGVQAERDRVQSILQMMFEAALNMGQGNKAVQYRHAMELLTPVEIQPYNEEDF